MIVGPHTDFMVAVTDYHPNHAEIKNDLKMKKQEPFSMNGFFPLYHTHELAMKNSPSGSVHSHKFNDGNVYYMPDASEGTEIFHGDYQQHHHASRKFLKSLKHDDNNEIVLTFRIDKDVCIQLLLVLILLIIMS
jgi:hypothetical protein